MSGDEAMTEPKTLATFVLQVPLGTFGWDDPKDPAQWQPNPLLSMSAQQQFNHNVDAGFLRLNMPTAAATPPADSQADSRGLPALARSPHRSR